MADDPTASALGIARDLVADGVTLPRRLALERAAAAAAPRRVLAVSVARVERAGAAVTAAYELERTRVHDVAIRLTAPHSGAGKWDTIAAFLRATPPTEHDWLIVFDDDVVLPRRFLDPFLFLCERFGFALAQPAHKFFSHGGWAAGRRHPGSVARRTGAIDSGLVVAVAARAFGVLDAPDWSAAAAEHGLPVGIVDATPVRRTRPVEPRPRPAALRTLEAYARW